MTSKAEKLGGRLAIYQHLSGQIPGMLLDILTHRAAPTTRNHGAPRVSGADVGKPW